MKPTTAEWPVQSAGERATQEPPTYRVSSSQTSAHRAQLGHTSQLQQPSLHLSFPSRSYPHTVHGVEPDCGTVWISTSNAKRKANKIFRRLRCNEHQRPHFQSKCESELIIWLKITSPIKDPRK